MFQINFILATILYKLKLKINGNVFKNVFHTKFEKKCLIKYITYPFFQMTYFENRHQNYWQSLQLAKIIKSLGYNIDVIDYNTTKFKAEEKEYDLLIDAHPSDTSIVRYLKNNVKKIAYLTGANPKFSNLREINEISRLKKIFNVEILPKRKVNAFSDFVNDFDAYLLIGNNVTKKTYGSVFKKKFFLIPNTGQTEIIGKSNISEISRSSKKFLFLGGNGQFLKGLHFLLDFFANNPELELYIFSNYKIEKDFFSLYKEKLECYPNIISRPFVDINNKKFIDVAKKCAYILLPSFSEGISGSVLTGMSLGLIPIVSLNSGFDKNEVICFKSLSQKDIANTLTEFSQKDESWIEEMSNFYYTLASSKYSRDSFTKLVKKAMLEIL